MLLHASFALLLVSLLGPVVARRPVLVATEQDFLGLAREGKRGDPAGHRVEARVQNDLTLHSLDPFEFRGVLEGEGENRYTIVVKVRPGAEYVGLFKYFHGHLRNLNVVVELPEASGTSSSLGALGVGTVAAAGYDCRLSNVSVAFRTNSDVAGTSSRGWAFGVYVTEAPHADFAPPAYDEAIGPKPPSLNAVGTLTTPYRMRDELPEPLRWVAGSVDADAGPSPKLLFAVVIGLGVVIVVVLATLLALLLCGGRCCGNERCGCCNERCPAGILRRKAADPPLVTR